MPQPWEAETEGLSGLARLFNDPNDRILRMGQDCMYDSRPQSPRSRPHSAAPGYHHPQPPSPRSSRPASARPTTPRGSVQQSYAPGPPPGRAYAAEARPQSPRQPSPRQPSPRQPSPRALRPHAAAAPASPRARALEQGNGNGNGNGKGNGAAHGDHRLTQLEQENDALRVQVDRLQTAEQLHKACDPRGPLLRYSPRRYAIGYAPPTHTPTHRLLTA